MRFVWPPISTALDERAKKIADGLATADRAKADAANQQQKLKEQLQQANTENAERLADAERQAQQMIDEAKAKAVKEGEKIIAMAKAEADTQQLKMVETLRDQVSLLALKGAQQILQKEINADTHAELLNRLKAEL
jgi:F-type H+-transporting ATPase subunit b